MLSLVWLYTTLVCGGAGAAEPAPGLLRLATTTSTHHSGILSLLLPPFEARERLRVDVIAVGTGKALRLAEAGDVDLVIAHAPTLEQQAVREGYLATRHPFMTNHFVLLGPPDDPADTLAAPSIVEAFRLIAAAGAPFVSRGDASGTHHREQSLWQRAGLSPHWSAYAEVGQGMGATLRIADERQAYTLSDSGTYFAFRSELELVVLSRSEPILANPYSVLPVDPAYHPHVNVTGARALIAWLTSAESQLLISAYRRNGEQLFQPLNAQP